MLIGVILIILAIICTLCGVVVFVGAIDILMADAFGTKPLFLSNKSFVLSIVLFISTALISHIICIYI